MGEPAELALIRAKRVFCRLRSEADLSETARVPATTFARRFAHYQDEAIREKVIVVTSHDRVVGGYLSASELENYERLKARERQVLRVGDLNEDVIADIAAAQYGAEAR